MTTIYYFTGTGNSQMIAEELAALLPDCKTEKITPELAKGTSVSGCAGVAFPVYFLGLPHIVREFLTNAEIQKGTYCFAGKYGKHDWKCPSLHPKDIKNKGRLSSGGIRN